MAQTFFLRPHRRRFAALLAALLAVPMLVVTAPAAAADEPTYELTWSHSGTDTDSSVFATSWSSSTTFDLNLHVTDADDLTGVSQTLDVSPAAEHIDCDPLPAAIDGSVSATCELTIDPSSIPTDGSFTITSTLTADGDIEANATATLLRFRGQTSVVGTTPVAVEVGDEVELEFEVDNAYSSPFEIRTDFVALGGIGDDGETLAGDCPAGDVLVEPGDAETVTCTFGPIAQDTSTGLRVSLRSTYPSDGTLGTLDSNAIEVQPSVNVGASADPDSLIDGGTSTVTFNVESDAGIDYDEVRATVVDGSGTDCDRDLAALDAGDTWTADDCVVEPAPGDETVLHLELDYETADGTQTYVPDPVVVDLTSDSTGLAVEARAGVMNQTLTPPGFVARDVLPLHPDPNYHLGGPAALEVTVSNPGTIDLVDVEVAADVPGCDRTLNIAGGDAETYTCDGPELSPGDATATTTVTATADAEGLTLEATDTADFSAFGIAADVTVDPDWDGVDLALPFLITIENVGAHELEWNAAAWQVVDQFGNWWDAPADTCSVASGDEFAPPAEQSPLPVGGTVTHDGCTLLAGDLVDGLTIRAVGVRDAWGEGPGSYDLVELQFDPDGAVHGTAELNGDAFADVTVELRLLELLELPRTEPEESASAAGAGDTVALSGDGDDCTSVGELDATDEGDIVATTASDADGDFCFDDVPPGTYEIVVDTDVDADLDEVVVDGAAGFTTNSPATSEPFFVGFASATLGEAVQASLTFSAVVPADDDDEESDDPGAVEPIDADTDDPEEELAATGGGATTITLVAVLALLLGAAILAISRRIAVRVTREVQPG